jgi:hypothetical protein
MVTVKNRLRRVRRDRAGSRGRAGNYGGAGNRGRAGKRDGAGNYHCAGIFEKRAGKRGSRTSVLETFSGLE